MQRILTGSVPYKVKVRANYQYNLLDKSYSGRKKVIKDYVFSPEYRVVGV